MKTFILGILSYMMITVAAEPVKLNVNIHALGGNVRGFGILAEYPQGEVTFKLTRKTKGTADLKPDLGGFANICSLRIFDPEGRLVQFVDLGQQEKPEQVYEIKLPVKMAGVWRFSVANGLSADRYQVEFSETPTWGIRGEMALGLGAGFPNTMYLYVPENSKLIIAERFGYGKGGFQLFDGQNEVSKFEQKGNRLLSVTPALPGKVLAVKFDNMTNKALAFDGLPGLLCPTPEAAQKLNGNIFKAAGLYVAGPFQKRVREATVKFKKSDFDFKLEFMKNIPENLENPQLEALPFGKYGPLGALASAAANQVLDPNNLYYGGNPSEKLLESAENWQDMLRYGSGGTTFSAGSLASAIETPTKTNPAYKNKELINRAIIAALFNFTALSGDDILREGDFRTGNYPQTHAFFTYEALAKAFEWLKDDLPAEYRELWQEGLFRVGDKAATFMAYQSNQWSHMINAFLNTYAGTGEERFKRYFEIHANAYLDNTFGPHSKFGQHPTGFYLEECGPDGNYDHLNGYSIAAAYYKYKEMKDADPKLVEKFRQGITKNLAFKRFFWLRQPNGHIWAPNAMNCRTDANLAGPSYPSDYMARPDFDLGYTRFMMNRMPDKGLGSASTFSHLVNNDEWAMRLLKAKTQTGINDMKADSFGGHWTREIYDVYKLPIKAKIVEIPSDAKSGLWELPGLIAWKTGKLYSIIFYDVVGNSEKATLPGITSGGLLTVWNQDTGSVIASMRNSARNQVKDLNDITWSGVYGYDPSGKLKFSGKERNKLTWLEPGKKFSIAANLKENQGKINWEYAIAGNQIELTVSLKDCTWRDATFSLPLLDAEFSKISFKDNVAECGKIKITVETATKAALSDSLKTAQNGYPVKALRIPFPADGTIKLKISSSE